MGTKILRRPIQEPHSLVISHESLSRALREDPFEFFVGLDSRRGLKLGVMLRPLLATIRLPDLVNDGACLRLDMRFLKYWRIEYISEVR